MSCLICAGDADIVDSLTGWEERICPQCGQYRISRALVLTLMEQGQIFDVEKMRRWLKFRRLSEAIPCIEVREDLLLP